ncbi:MAG: hypothetical protein AAGB05_14825 [Pseudomonadota bacterium]
MGTATANKFQPFLDSAVGKVTIKNLAADMDAALANAKRLQNTSAAKGGSSSAVTAWKKDCTLLKQLRLDLGKELKLIQNGKAESLKTLDEIVADSAETLDWVEQRNHAYQMLHNAQLDVKMAAMLPVLGLVSSHGSQAILLQRKLAQLTKDLKAAEKATTSKTAKAALTAVMVAGTMLLPPLGLAGTMFALAASLVAADIGGRAIDYAVGEAPSPPDKLKAVYTVADSSIGAAGQVSKAAEALGKKSAALGVAWDAGDAGYALYKKKNIEKRIAALIKEAKAASKGLEKQGKLIKKLQKDAVSALNTARSNASSFASSKAARDKVRKDFKEFNDLN